MGKLPCLLVLVAQAVPLPAADPLVEWGKLAKDVGATGLMMWIVWWMLSKAIPALIEKFTAEAAAARTAYLAQAKDLRDQFTAELKDSRATFQAEIAATRDHCREELDRLRPPKV